ncbi:HAD family hydrolase [Metabacillus indicus]|uniref:HAD family hydrolase n=1 Tax=Metabacillus indicus TaxID=246786 RepID=UPI002A05DF9B|nr:HAD family hydrolase [Metabacillus indicus]MDX8288850.1 HAD family hydrolase [Metabacillus indicus]
MSNETYHMVKEFHETFGQKTADKPTAMDPETALKRAVWTGEELIEFLYASVDGDRQDFINIVNSFGEQLGKVYRKHLDEKPAIDDILTAQADALTDIEYFNQGTFTLLGVEPFNLFKIVQEANMGKLWDDGKPRFRESDGKILKPPHWEEKYAPEPRLKQEIQRQIDAKKAVTVKKVKKDQATVIEWNGETYRLQHDTEIKRRLRK